MVLLLAALSLAGGALFIWKKVKADDGDGDVTAPVEVAYKHLMDEAKRRVEGPLDIGTPVKTATRIEVPVAAEGEQHTLVAVEKANDGITATVVVGPKDAGAVRIYTLLRKPAGWEVGGFEDLDE